MNIWLDSTDHLNTRWKFGLQQLGHIDDRTKKPDIYITDSASVRRLNGFSLDVINDKNTLKVLSINDEPRESAEWKTIELSKLFDVVVCPTLQTEYLFDKPFIHMPLTFHPKWHYPISRPKEYDIVFIGRMDAQRKEFYAKFSQKYNVFTTTKCNLKCNREVYAKGKIALHYKLWSDNPKSHEKSEYQGCRFWQSLACGIFTITDERGDMLINNARYYNTYEEAMKLVKYYLKHDDEREQVAMNGLKEVQSHNVIHRMKYLLKELERFKK